jgi:glycosyltransferase involved in cell wall biosynthesis
MRILQLIGAFDASGAETVVLNLSNQLRQRGYDVTVCSRLMGPLVPLLRDVEHVLIPKRHVVDWQYVKQLVALVRRLDVDVIHTHLFGNDIYGFLVAQLTGRAYVCTLHGADSLQSRKRIAAYRMMVPFTGHVVAVSEMLHDRFVKECWANPRMVSVVRNGIDVTPRTVDAAAKRRSLGLSERGPVIGAVGNVKRVKGYEVLLDAFARVRREHPDAQLIIAGATEEDPAYTEEILAQRKALGLDGAVDLLGSRPDVRELLPLLSAYVVSSHSEGTSLALLEAMASRRAIVATDVGGNPLVVTHEQSGLLVPPARPDALAESISSVLSDPDLASRLGNNARAAVDAKYGLDQMVDGYAAVYEQALAKKRRSWAPPAVSH